MMYSFDMRHVVIAAVAAVAVVQASPYPQGVTDALSPTGSMPPGCTGSRHGTFGIALVNITEGSSAMRHLKRQMQTEMMR